MSQNFCSSKCESLPRRLSPMWCRGKEQRKDHLASMPFLEKSFSSTVWATFLSSCGLFIHYWQENTLCLPWLDTKTLKSQLYENLLYKCYHLPLNYASLWVWLWCLHKNTSKDCWSVALSFKISVRQKKQRKMCISITLKKSLGLSQIMKEVRLLLTP